MGHFQASISLMSPPRYSPVDGATVPAYSDTSVLWQEGAPLSADLQERTAPVENEAIRSVTFDIGSTQILRNMILMCDHKVSTLYDLNV